jgi:hypothetical protein
MELGASAYFLRTTRCTRAPALAGRAAARTTRGTAAAEAEADDGRGSLRMACCRYDGVGR